MHWVVFLAPLDCNIRAPGTFAYYKNLEIAYWRFPGTFAYETNLVIAYWHNKRSHETLIAIPLVVVAVVVHVVEKFGAAETEPYSGVVNDLVGKLLAGAVTELCGVEAVAFVVDGTVAG